MVKGAAPAVKKASAEPFPQLGRITKRIRLSRGLTLDEVSRLTGLSKSMLSKVENEKSSLTYENLVRLSRGLQVDIEDLFATDAPSRRAEFTERRTIGRKGQGKPIRTVPYGESYLCTDFKHKKLIPVITNVKARSLQEFGPLSSHRGEEFLFIVEGTVEFHYEGYEPITLEVGDYIYFDSSTPHAYLNAGSGDAVCLSVMSPPGPSHFRAKQEQRGAMVSQVGSPFSGTPLVSRTPAAGGPPAHVLQVAGLVASAAARQTAELVANNDPTQLLNLHRLAKHVGLAEVLYKDEGQRCGAGTFKAVGAASAVYRVLADRIEAQGAPRPTVGQLASGACAHLTANVTLACAGAGDIGQAVAWAARAFRCKSHIFLCDGVADERAVAIRAQGAEVTRLSCGYDEAVRWLPANLPSSDWALICETGVVADHQSVALDFLRSYTLIADEIVRDLRKTQPPTHVFVQAGVGNLAAALNVRFWESWGQERPRFIVVEPAGAAGLYLSARNNALMDAPAPVASRMTDLCVGRPFEPAWEILQAGANDFLIIEDAAAEEAMRRYAADPGELEQSRPSLSALAGLAALQVVMADPMTREVLELVPSSRVLLIGTDCEPKLAAPETSTRNAQTGKGRAARAAPEPPSARTAKERSTRGRRRTA